MAFVSADRVSDTTTVTGTGNVTVSGVAPTGYRTLSAVLSVGDTFYYCISDQTTGKWETGTGTYVSANVFARTTVLSSSNSGNAVVFTDGIKTVFVTFPAAQMLQTTPGTVGASAINVVATGSATLRTLAARAADTTNVLDFGADPTGTTECSSAIQAAINYAAAKGSSFPASQGGLVIFPEGTYLIGSTLTLASGVVLSGEGVWNTVLKASSSFSSIMISAISTSTATTISQAGVENMSIFGRSQLTTGIQFQNNNRSFVRNCRFFGHNYAYAGADNWEISLLDLWAGEAASSQQNNVGFYFYWSGTQTFNPDLNNVHICQNCNVQGALLYGFRAENAQGSMFTNCQAVGESIDGWYFGDCPNVGGTYSNLQFIYLDNCQSDTESGHGFKFSRGSSPTTTGIILTNIWAGLETTSNKANIYFANMNDVVLNGFFTASSSYSIIADTCDSLIISNGRCTNYDYYNSGSQAIYLTSCTNCQVLGCNLTPYSGAASAGAGIYETGSSNKNLVIDNVLPKGWSMVGANSIARDNMGVSGPIADYGKYLSAASTTTQASLNIPAGTAPTSPSNGDIWFDGTNLKIRIGGATKTFTVV